MRRKVALQSKLRLNKRKENLKAKLKGHSGEHKARNHKEA